MSTDAQRSLSAAHRLVLDADSAGLRRERSVGAILTAIAELDPLLLIDAVADARGRLSLDRERPAAAP